MAKKQKPALTFAMVKHSRTTEFIGRNGTGQQTATNLYYEDHHRNLWVGAITSRGKPAKGHIEVPLEDLPKLAKALLTFYDAHKHKLGTPSGAEKLRAELTAAKEKSA